MYALMNVRKPARPPFTFSSRPYTDPHGRERKATITIHPSGRPVTGEPAVEPSTHLSLILSLDEAEALSNELTTLVADTKNGKFSEFGDALIAREPERAKGD